MDRAEAWRDCPATPERLAHINQLAANFYTKRYPNSWAQTYLTQRFGTDPANHPTLQVGYAPTVGPP